MNLQPTLRFGLMLALVVGLLFLGLNVLRLAFIFNIMHGFLLLNMLALGIIAACGVWHWRRLQVRALEWALLGVLLLGAAAADYAGRSWVDVGIDIVRPVLFLLTVRTLGSLVDIEAVMQSRYIQALLKSTVWVTLGTVLLCYGVSNFVQPLYPAYSTIDSTMGLGWLLASGSFGSSLGYALLLFVSGKRGVYLAAFVVLLLVARRKRQEVLAVLATIMVAVGMGSALSHTGSSFIAKAPPPELEAMFEQGRASKQDMQVKQNKASANDVDDPSFSPALEKFLNIASGGRLDEVRDATASIASPYTYLLGAGPGFSYHSQIFAFEEKPHRNLHFTPLSILIYYGVVFAALFAWYLWGKLVIAWRILGERTASPVLFTYAAYFVASLPFALTEYSVFVYANFAIACGLLEASVQRRNTVKE